MKLSTVSYLSSGLLDQGILLEATQYRQNAADKNWFSDQKANSEAPYNYIYTIYDFEAATGSWNEKDELAPNNNIYYYLQSNFLNQRDYFNVNNPHKIDLWQLSSNYLYRQPIINQQIAIQNEDFILLSSNLLISRTDFASNIDSEDTQTHGETSPQPAPISLGTNLHRLAAWSPQMPFLNAFKSARQWIPQNWGEVQNEEGRYEYVWDTGEFEQLDIDANGWVKSLPAPEEQPEYSSVGTLMFRDVGTYPGGKYVVLYEGEGNIEYSLDGKKDKLASTPGRDVINVTPSDAGIWLRITDTDPNQTGDYLRNIRVVPEEYENVSQIFNPAFIAKLQPFNTLRFMDWMLTNNSQQGEWSQRPIPENSSFSGEMASVEEMVALSNLTDSDPWFNMPHMATDEYVYNFASYVKENLDPELKVYVEYSNEVWNTDFSQGWWIEQQGKNELGSSDSGYTKRIDWFGKRTTEITQIWDDVFETDHERVIGVLGAQAANPWIAKRALKYDWSDNPLSHEEYGIDAIAIAPYFGSYLGNPEHKDQIEDLVNNQGIDSAVDSLFEELTTGGVLYDAPSGGALQQAYDWTAAYVDLAEQENLALIGYEAGQHLNGNRGVQENAAVTELFIAANRDSRMQEVYEEYFVTLNQLGLDLSVNYTDVSDYNKWGSWGALENIYQESSPKYDAIINVTAKTIGVFE